MEKSKILDFFPPVGIPFVVELELTSGNEDSAAKLMGMCLDGGEILPGVKVKSVYRSVETPKTVVSDMLVDGIEKEYNDMVRSIEESMRKFLENRYRITQAREEKLKAIKKTRGGKS